MLNLWLLLACLSAGRQDDPGVEAGRVVEQLQPAVVKLGAGLNDRETEAQALNSIVGGRGPANETLRSALALVWRDARPGIQDIDHDRLAVLMNAGFHRRIPR